MLDRFWATLVEQMFASGHAHQQMAIGSVETLTVVDDYGTVATWVYDKEKGEISLIGA